ncbi:acetyl-CoA carboxylase biotin carboxylase subunit family protein [Streptomyces sp. HK10]|uniref:ATP-grasp domain-containing protein n=1 Tax=Streptomyces sp. HK10 TaxID=3373255 RepID=UPI00374A51D8
MPPADRAHYLVINRYDDEDADYARHCAGHTCDLSYVTLSDCVAALGANDPGRVAVVPSLTVEAVLQAARELAGLHGAFDGVAGLSEYDVLTAAMIRDSLGVPGPSHDLVRGFKDKVEMKRRLSAAGVPVPRFAPVGPGSPVAEVEAAVGLPVVLKPRSGAGSAGVRVIHDREGLAAELAALTEPDSHECEEYVSDEIYHADGVLSGGQRHFVSVSGYANTPLDFARGMPLGSVVLDPGPLRTRIADFAVECVTTLGLKDGCFHLEAIRRPTGELLFLEVGLRPGGAEVPFVHRDFYGIDLATETFRSSVGMPLETEGSRFPDSATVGWVVFPEPARLPSRIVSCTSMAPVVPQVYAEVLPAVGEVFDGTGGYFHVPGRFRLTGPDERNVRAAVRRVMAEYTYEAEPAT